MADPTTLVRTPGQSPLLPGTVTANGFVFTSGLIAPAAFAAMADGTDVPAQQQLTEVVALLRTTLAAAGTDVDRVVKLTAYLSSAELFGAWNEAFVSVWPEPGPARTTLVVGFASPVVHVELEAVAVL